VAGCNSNMVVAALGNAETSSMSCLGLPIDVMVWSQPGLHQAVVVT